VFVNLAMYLEELAKKNLYCCAPFNWKNWLTDNHNLILPTHVYTFCTCDIIQGLYYPKYVYKGNTYHCYYDDPYLAAFVLALMAFGLKFGSDDFDMNAHMNDPF